MRTSIFELSLIHKRRRKKHPIALSPGKSGQIVLDRPVVNNVVGVDYQSLVRKYVVLVYLRCDNDRGIGNGIVVDIKKAVSERPLFLEFTVEPDFVFDGLHPLQGGIY